MRPNLSTLGGSCVPGTGAGSLAGVNTPPKPWGAAWRSSPATVWSVLLALSLTAPALGAEAGAAVRVQPTELHWVDWAIIVAYLGGVLALGQYFAKRQSSNAEYFTAARTHIPPFLVGVSLFASLLSTISYLGKPGEMINKGPVVLIGQVLSLPFAYYIVGYWIVPRLMQQRVTSAYELLEKRLGVTGRLVGAILFVKLRLVWMGLLVHVASTAIAVILGFELRWVPALAVVVGLVPLIYTSMGGLRAVVVANVVQYFLLLLGAILTVAIVTVRCGGFSWWPTAWSPYWDVQPFFSLDPHVRVTVFGATIRMLVWRVCTAGGDQMVIQHYMATRDAVATRRSYLIMCWATFAVTVMLAIVGLALLGFFSRFPQLLGPGMELEKSADHLFPYFVSNFLPVGVSGLVVAAIIAASSGMDTGVNAVTAVVMKDFLERFGWQAATEARRLRTTKYLSFAIGTAVVGASLLIPLVPGNILEVTNKLANLEATTIFGLFFLALFVPCATPLGAIMGAVYGLTASVLVAFWDVLTGRPPISFLYIGVVGLSVDLGVGYAVSRLGPRPGDRRATRWVGAGLCLVLGAAVALLLAAPAAGGKP